MPSLSSDIWKLPSINKFLHDIGQKLIDGISLVILFPNSTDLLRFQQSLLRQLEAGHPLTSQVLDLGSGNGNKPLEFLREVIPLFAKYQYIDQAIEDEDLPDVLILTHLEKCCAAQQAEWINVLARWSEACRSTGSRHSLALLTRAESVSNLLLPQPDVRLAYHLWAGIPSALESRLVFRGDTNSLDAEGQWRENILSSLAANDLQLGEFLWDFVVGDVDEIILQLRQYAHEMDWSIASTRKLLENWRPTIRETSTSFNPNNNSFALLSRGITIYTPENGEELHPAVLAVMEKEEEIVHRLWRAQASLILPVIDDIRLRVCNSMKNRHGVNWAGQIEDQNPTYPDLGKLKFYFDKLPEKDSDRKLWGRIIKQAWMIRNKLAHYKIIDFQAYQNLWYGYVHIRKMINP